MVKKIVSKVIVIEEWCIIIQTNSWEIQFSGHCSKLMYTGKENWEGYRRKLKEKNACLKMPQRDSKIESGNLCMNGLMINIHVEVKYGKKYLSVKKKTGLVSWTKQKYAMSWRVMVTSHWIG